MYNFAPNKGNEPHITVITYCLRISMKTRNPQVKKVRVQNVSTSRIQIRSISSLLFHVLLINVFKQTVGLFLS